MSFSFVFLRPTFLALISPRKNRLPEQAGAISMNTRHGHNIFAIEQSRRAGNKHDELFSGKRVRHHTSLLHRKALLQFAAWFILGAISLVARGNDLQLWLGGRLLGQGDCNTSTLDQWCAERAYKDIQHYPDVKPISCVVLTGVDCQKAFYPTGFGSHVYCKTTYYSCTSTQSFDIGYYGVACPPGQDWIAPDVCSTTPQQLKVLGRQYFPFDGSPVSQSCHPIDFSFGNKIFTETSYRGSGAFPIEFTLTYNGLATTLASARYWSYSYGQRITHSSTSRHC